MSELLIKGGTIVNEGAARVGYILVKDRKIVRIGDGNYTGEFRGRTIDAAGKLVMPGVIDDQVHFRQPGLTDKGDIASESRAAVAGGITSYMDMPNTVPPATSHAELERKFDMAARSSLANYSFYLGATADNIKEITGLDPRCVCGVKVFMGSSTGGMLVDSGSALEAIFAESPVPIATHCESEPIIRTNIERYKKEYGDAILPSMHPVIRSAEACYRSSAQAVALADKYGSHLHVLHLSTERELSLFDSKPLESKKITNEVCVHHLWFSDEDYAAKRNFIKWNPAIKTVQDRDALRAGLLNGKVDVVATDHAPHTLAEKRRPYWECPSGGPLVQHSLAAMFELAAARVIPLETVVEKMSHAPAVRFGVRGRGFLREGYHADIAIVDPDSPWTVSRENILYKCGWSPFEGTTFTHRVTHTIIDGRVVWDDGRLDDDFRGSALEFGR